MKQMDKVLSCMFCLVMCSLLWHMCNMFWHCALLLCYSSKPYSLEVDTALKWLNGSFNSKFPDSVLLYFSNIDSAGHEAGPNSLLVRTCTKNLVSFDILTIKVLERLRC
jgi:predicted AlkP superfamily pyrophosphatase or phosphodiesterase